MPHLVGESFAPVAATMLTPAVLAFDAAGRLLHRSASAAALLNALADPGDLGGREQRPARDALPEVITMAVSRARDPGSHTVFGRDGRVYVLEAMPAIAQDARDPAAPRTYVVIAPAPAPDAARATEPWDDTASLAERYGLSPREHEMLRRIARGDANKAIAAALGLSVHTVQEYVGRACRKVGVRTRRELVARLLGA